MTHGYHLTDIPAMHIGDGFHKKSIDRKNLSHDGIGQTKAMAYRLLVRTFDEYNSN